MDLKSLNSFIIERELDNFGECKTKEDRLVRLVCIFHVLAEQWYSYIYITKQNIIKTRLKELFEEDFAFSKFYALYFASVFGYDPKDL